MGGIAPEQAGSAVLYATVNSPGQALSLWAEGHGEEAFKRLLGIAIISVMPEPGLEEALFSLRDIFEFRSHAYRPSLPESTRGRRTKGKVARTSQRPDLVLTE